MKVISLTIFLLVLSMATLTAMNIDYFYSETCPHCAKVTPIINNLEKEYSCVNWNYRNVAIEENSKALKNYASGVPTIVINDLTILVGSQEIPMKLPCEVQQMSTLSCETYPASMSMKDGGWFIW